MGRFPIILSLTALLVVLAACDRGVDDEDVLDLNDYETSTFLENLSMPNSLSFAPDGRLFFAEVHSGRIRIVEDGHLRDQPFAEFDVARPGGYTEHGLLGLALHPDFEDNGYVYAFYTVGDDAGNPVGQRIVRLIADGNVAIDQEVIVDDLPFGASCCHNGGRIAFGPDGHLYATIGDIERPAVSQDLEHLAGSVLRYTDSGAIPPDNPFGPESPVYAYGLRNPFGLAFHPETGALFVSDNGPTGYDEINSIEPGGNYGWPEVQGVAGDDRFIDPIWATTTERIAPTGVTVPAGSGMPELEGRVLFCMWNLSMLMALELDPDDPTQVRSQAELPVNCNLDVVEGPDGAIYTSTDIRIYRYGPPGD